MNVTASKIVHSIPAVVEIGTFVCPTGGGGDTIIEVETQVSAVAEAIAEVVAEVNYECVATGDTNAVASVRAQAERRAQAVSEAVAGVLDSKIVCPGCTARVESLVNSTQELIAIATLDAFFEVRHPMLDRTINLFHKSRSSAKENVT